MELNSGKVCGNSAHQTFSVSSHQSNRELVSWSIRAARHRARFSSVKALQNIITNHQRTHQSFLKHQNTTTKYHFVSHRLRNQFSLRRFPKKPQASKRNTFYSFAFHKGLIQYSIQPMQVCCTSRITRLHRVVAAAEALCSLRTDSTTVTQPNSTLIRLKLSNVGTTRANNRKEAHRLRGNPLKRIQNLRSTKKANRKVTCGKGERIALISDISRVNKYFIAVNTILRQPHFSMLPL